VKSDAYLRFATLVATEKFSSLYDEAIQLLGEFRDLAVFPVQRFRQYAAHAIIASERGEPNAQYHAQAALAAAVETSSGFRYHQELGLVADMDQSLEQKLREIAAG
jgi:hypothetical protein